MNVSVAVSRLTVQNRHDKIQHPYYSWCFSFVEQRRYTFTEKQENITTRLIAPSITNGAVKPSCRNAAKNVVVGQGGPPLHEISEYVLVNQANKASA